MPCFIVTDAREQCGGLGFGLAREVSSWALAPPVLTLVLLLAPLAVGAQEWQWVQGAGGIFPDRGNDVAVDNAGNTFVVGIFSDTATFGPVTLTSLAGSVDLFVAKYAPDGSVLWAQRAGGPNPYPYIEPDEAHGVAVDAAGNAYVTGYVGVGNATFGPFVITEGGTFLAKYSPNGEVLWVRRAGRPLGGPAGVAVGWGIAVDSLSHAHITGTYRGTVEFGSFTLTSVGWPGGSDDVFLAKYDPDGTVLWAKSAGGSNWDHGYAVAVDGSGNAYVTGFYTGIATFGQYTLTSTDYRDRDIFLVKYAPNGAVLWARRAGAPYVLTAEGVDEGRGVAVDESGDAYVTGSFYGTADFGAVSLTSSGRTDIFLAKYAPDGTVRWARSAGGSAPDGGYSIAVDRSGRALVTGFFWGTADFGPFVLTSSGDYDVFVATYSPEGEAVGVLRAGGPKQDLGYGAALDGSGNAYITGRFAGIASFGPFTLTDTGAAQHGDVFVAKLHTVTTSTEGGPEETVAFRLSEPNPNPFNSRARLVLSVGEAQVVRVILHDMLGRPVRVLFDGTALAGQPIELVVDGTALPSGVYLVRATGEQVSATRQVVLSK